MQPGTIIILNGTSSSGKSTLLHKLQEKLDQPYLEFGLDKAIWMLPRRYFTQPLWDEVLGRANQAGDYGHQLVRGLHRAIRTLSENGLNILMDHVLVEPDWVADCAEQLADMPAYLIGVYCELEILEKREKQRNDRTLGQARAQFDKVHTHGHYDLLVDSGKYSVEENLMQILLFIESEQPPKALNTLRSRST